MLKLPITVLVSKEEKKFAIIFVLHEIKFIIIVIVLLK